MSQYYTSKTLNCYWLVMFFGIKIGGKNDLSSRLSLFFASIRVRGVYCFAKLKRNETRRDITNQRNDTGIFCNKLKITFTRILE